jgi:hypothetical protein
VVTLWILDERCNLQKGFCRSDVIGHACIYWWRQGVKLATLYFCKESERARLDIWVVHQRDPDLHVVVCIDVSLRCGEVQLAVIDRNEFDAANDLEDPSTTEEFFVLAVDFLAYGVLNNRKW